MDLGAVLGLVAVPSLRAIADFDQGDARVSRLELQQLDDRLEMGVEHGVDINHKNDILCYPALALA
tara:strand:+ start:195 stop:392 length:198 start_codon:yes stop_codon:yes gene_type:complete|eukprot:scaffold104224_cov57-Phaeocystis_antarctica.AAC.1